MIKFWQWPNIMAIDAALVAIGWQYLLVQEFFLSYSPMTGLILGLSVWLTYVGDRWLDVQKIEPQKISTLRHRFTQRYARPLLGIWLLILIINGALAFSTLSPDDLLSGFILLLGCIIYTLLNQLKRTARTVPKEFFVSLIFSAGLIVFNLDEPIERPLHIVLALLSFFMLCCYNCTLLAKVEIDIDRAQATSSMVQQYRTLARHLYLLGALALVLGSILAINGSLLLSLSVILIGSVYLGLDKWHRHIHPENLRTVTDGILILPFLIHGLIS